MKRGGHITKVFLAGNTTKGFYSFYDSLLKNLEKIFILRGEPGSGKSTFMRRIGLDMVDRGYDVEFIYCPVDSDSLDGVIIPKIKLGILDGEAPHPTDYSNIEEKVEILDLGPFQDQEIAQTHREALAEGKNQREGYLAQAYAFLKEAKGFLDRWEGYFFEGLDFEKADQLRANLLARIFARKPRARHFFVGAITPEGFVNHIASITQKVKTRYILKGNPGTGKSTLIKRVAEEALARGYDVDLYHCAFDPNSLDLAVIPGLNTCVLNGSVPHGVGNQKEGDFIIDMQECIDSLIINKNKTAVRETADRFHQLALEAVRRLGKAKKIQDRLELYTIEAMDFAALDNFRQKIFNKILALAEEELSR